MPSSTVWRSFTLKDGKGRERWKLRGKRLSQVSSPMNTTRLPEGGNSFDLFFDLFFGLEG